MVVFFDIISFFAIASLFAWLGYGPLLGEKGISKGLGILTDYFMFSFWFYGVSAVADYFLQHLEGVAHFWTGVVVAASFALGTETLLVATYYIRRFGKTGFDQIDVPPFSIVMRVTYYLTAGAIASAAGYYYFTISFVGKSFFVELILVSWYGAYRYLKSWRKPSRVNRLLMMWPVFATFAWILLSIILFVLLGWPFMS